ncbi:MAG: hypothetical protein ACJA2S_004658 [Cyclobacteriaceae bacterium]|jgi:hypothetical protein
MKNIIKKTLMVLLVVQLVSTSCTDGFEEINTNPNQTEIVTNPGLLLPGVIRSSMDDYYTGAFRRGNVVADYLSNQFVSAFDWNPNEATEYFLWTFYENLRDLQTMADIAEEKDLKNFQGVALVMKSFFFQNMTDIYGEIPYSEATSAKSDGLNFPKYDTQEEIYTGILSDLELANTLLSTSNGAVTGDILFNGDVTKWKKFANSLRLRCLMRRSDRVDPSADMQQIVGDPATYPIFTENDDQAALQYLDELGNEYPRYRSAVGQFVTSTHASKTMVDILSGLSDPRLFVFALPTESTAGSASPEYVGVPNGILNEDAFNGGQANQSNAGLLWAPLDYDPELASPTAVQSVMMTFSEVQLILAEAAERGFITGDAEAFYLSGIQAQFDYYASRIPDNYTFPTAADVQPDPSYFAQADVSYTGTQQEKLDKIALQKWLTLFNNGYEGWSEWRRTGSPNIVAGPASLGFVPVRHLYPLSEQGLNKGNYDASVARQGADNTQTKVWWDVD